MFLHDGLGAIESWRDFPGRVCPPRRGPALLYDRWGHGRSQARRRFRAGFMEAEAEFLVAVLDEFGWQRADLVGHSDGGTIALLCAAACPDRVSSVVSIAAHCFVEPATTRSIERLLGDARAGRLPRWLRRLHGDRAEQLLAAWAQVWLSEEHAAWRIEADLRVVRCPVLAIQGTADEFGTLDQLAAIEASVAGARVRAMARVGHTPHAENAAAVAAEILDFWGCGPD